MRICFDKRVIAGLGIVAVTLLVFAPQTLGAAAPLLVMAACPISMVVMMRAMNRRDQNAASDTKQSSATPVVTAAAPTRSDV